MGDWPDLAPTGFRGVTITTYDALSSVGGTLAAFAQQNAGGTCPMTTANLARFVPFIADRRITVLKMAWVNGATVAGNNDVAVYDLGGNRMGGTGSVAQSGATAIQSAAVAANFTIGPGVYFLALNNSTTTATFSASGTLLGIPCIRGMGCLQVASAIPIGDPVTFAAAGANFTRVPLFGLSAITAI